MAENDQDTCFRKCWWERSDLMLKQGILMLEGADVQRIAQDCETPTYVYNRNRISANLSRLLQALNSAHPRSRLFYAMKSNRYEPLLRWLASLGNVGIDACSPGEMELALQCGFKEEQISFTATGMGYREWENVLKHADVRVNADSFGDILKIGQISPGRKIGLRVNPEVSLGYRQNPKLMYTQQSQFSKFGISIAQFEEAIRFAKSVDLQVHGIHSHSGCGYLNEQWSQYVQFIDRLRGLTERFTQIEYLNLGGGLGIPLVEEDTHWDLQQWSSLLRSRFSGWKGELYCEPGDYIVKDSGILLTEVTNIEIKCGKKVVWVNAGFNVHLEPVFYNLPLFPVAVSERTGEKERITIVGNINEGHDIWMEDVFMTPLQEGDFIALLNAGGYGASMSSNHCCRGEVQEMMIPG